MSYYVGFTQGKVHESHVISEYYCGRCGWPVTDHDSFCPECGGALRECDATPDVVYCKYCRWCESDDGRYGAKSNLACVYRPLMRHATEPNDYCSRGESRY